MSYQYSRNGQGILASYQGPYPLDQLQRARATLIYGFNTYNSCTFDRLNRIIYLENASHDSNWEYSEDNYTDSEVEPESGIRPILDQTVKGQPNARYDPCAEQEMKAGSRGESSRSEMQFERPSEASNAPFYSAAGFKNRFAQQMPIKQTAPEKITYNINELKQLKRKIPGYSNGEDSANVTNGESSMKKTKKIDSDLLDNEKPLLEGFKCDYCNFTSQNREETLSHLNGEQHAYASRCQGEIEEGKFSPFYITEEMCLQSEKKRWTKVASCPKCFIMFSNIYTCASHSKVCCKNMRYHQDGLYALSNVVRDTDALIPVDSICQTCKLKCAKHRALNIHYEACKHYPFDQPSSPGILLSFLCRYCDKDFNNFFVAKAHVITHAVKQPRVLMALQLIYYEMTMVSHRLLPKRRLPIKTPTRVRPAKKKKKKQRKFE